MHTTRVAQCGLAHDLRSAGRARGLAVEIVTAWGYTTIADDVRLVVSELVTNAVRHGKPPIEMVLSECEGAVLVQVIDHGDIWVFPPLSGHMAEYGRGLGIVGKLATLDVNFLSVHGPGKIVSAQIPLPRPPAV